MRKLPCEEIGPRSGPGGCDSEMKHIYDKEKNRLYRVSGMDQDTFDALNYSGILRDECRFLDDHQIQDIHESEFFSITFSRASLERKLQRAQRHLDEQIPSLNYDLVDYNAFEQRQLHTIALAIAKYQVNQ